MPRGICELGTLRELTLDVLDQLREIPDPIGLTALDSLVIVDCFNIQALPRGIGKLGALTQLTLDRLAELQEIPDLIGLTAPGFLQIRSCDKIKAHI